MDPVAVLGVAFRKLCATTKNAKDRCRDFTSAFDNLEQTIKLLTPKIEEMDRLNQELEDYPREEIRMFLQLLEKATALVSTCSDIPKWNMYKKHKYQKRLRELDTSLVKLSKVELQTAQALNIQRVLLDVLQMNKKLDMMNLHERGPSKCFESEIRVKFRLGFSRKQ